MKRLYINTSNNEKNISLCCAENYIDLEINDIPVPLNMDIIRLAIAKNTIIVITDDPDMHNKTPLMIYQENITKGRKGNLFAFSHDGSLLWCINDLVEKIIFPFYSGLILSDTEKDMYSKQFGVQFEDDHEFFVGLTCGDEHYLIDLTTQKFITKISYKN